jgi:hypothetical protein
LTFLQVFSYESQNPIFAQFLLPKKSNLKPVILTIASMIHNLKRLVQVAKTVFQRKRIEF